jgi:glycosyltransferase involved in cell wall biosynthesis
VSDLETSQPLAQPPRVSVIIPAYNAAAFIAETLQSVFTQTFTNFEVIVVNDGSPDTADLERQLQQFRERITYLKQENLGPSAARNAAIRAAHGEFLAFLDSDDCWLRDYLASQMKSFQEHPELDLVCADTMFYGDPQLEGKTFFSCCRLQGPVTFGGLLIENPLTTSCVVARTRVVLDAGLFDETLRVAEDYDLWLRIAATGALIKRRWKVLARHRMHSSSLSSEDETLWLKSHIRVLANMENRQLSQELREQIRRQLICFRVLLDTEEGKRHLARGAFDEAISCFANVNALRGSGKVRLILTGLRVAPKLTRCGAKIWQRLIKKRVLDGCGRRRWSCANHQAPSV